jgi:thioredoxin reductase
VLTTGVQWRKLEATGVERLTGKGVLYGAARTEAHSVLGKKIFIVGGGNSAGQAAMFFSGYASSVTMLVRGKDITHSMSQYLTRLCLRPTSCTPMWLKIGDNSRIGPGRAKNRKPVPSWTARR